jgi:TolA-binding protein
LYRLGFLQFNQGNYKVAVKHFDNFRVKFNGQVKLQQLQDANIYLGRAKMELDQYKIASAIFSALAAEPKAGAKVFFWQGRVLNRQKKYAAAVKVLDGAIKKFPNDPEMPDLLFDLANNNMSLNNFAEAGIAFDDLRKAKPDFGQMSDLLYLNALCKHRTKNYVASLKLCSDFLGEHKKHKLVGEVDFLEAENQFFLNQYAKAIDSYDNFLGDYKTHVRVNAAKMRIGQSHYKLKNWGNVLGALEPLMKSRVKGLVFDQLEFLVADAHYQLGDWVKAAPLYRDFVEAKPKSVNADTALNRAGHAFENLKKFNEAIAAYQKLVVNYPHSDKLPPACLKLGEWYAKSKQYSKAKAVLQRVVALTEHDLRPEAEYKLAFVESGEGDVAAAAKRFGVMVDTFPQHELAADARLQQGMKLFDADQFPGAQTALQKFIADYPKHEKIEDATYQLGFSQVKQDQWQEALASFAKVPETSRYRADALYQSAWCQKGADKKPDAVPYYEELLAEFPESPLANTSSLELAELEYEANKLNEAIRRVQGLILKKPKKDLLARAQRLLGLVYYDQKDFDKALLNFQDVVKASKPTRRSKGDELGAEAQFRMGQCYYEQEMFDKAIEEYKKVESGFAFPLWQSMAIYEVAVTLARKGDEAEAQEQLKQLVEKFPDTPAAAEAKAKLK